MADLKVIDTDVAIMGGGAAGIAAGIEARDQGARVVVIEKLAEPGGAAIISGGGCLLVGTPLQEKNGIKDSPDLAFNDWMKWGGPSADAEWARYYIEHTLHDLYHWGERNGVRWMDLKVQEGNSVFRWTRAEKSGLGLMTALINSYLEKGGKILKETTVDRLVFEEGRVGGIEGHTASGDQVKVTAKAVIVAAGGFNSNIEMVRKYNPHLDNDRVMEGSGFGSTGDGHVLIEQAGGYLTHMDHVWYYVYATPDYRYPDHKRGLVFRLVPGYVWVNQQGKRFHNEALSGGNSGAPAMLAQSPRYAWAIVDQPMTSKMEVADPYYRRDDTPLRDKNQEPLDRAFARVAAASAPSSPLLSPARM